MPVGSKLFAGYRALGFVSDHVPLAVRYNQKHKENYVVTSVGKAFHTYNVSIVGDNAGLTITFIPCDSSIGICVSYVYIRMLRSQ